MNLRREREVDANILGPEIQPSEKFAASLSVSIDIVYSRARKGEGNSSASIASVAEPEPWLKHSQCCGARAMAEA